MSRSRYVFVANVSLIPANCNIDDNLGKLVIQDIIPAIAHLRQKHRLMFSAFFQPDLMFSSGIVPDIVEVGDLLRSDEFFNSIQYKYVF